MGSIWLPDLPDVIARAGIPVTTWPGWETRCNAKGGYDGIFGVAVHHTASNASATNDMTYMWDNALLRPVGAIYLARDGKVTVGAAGQTNCQGMGGPRSTSKGTIPLDQGNRYAIAIEAANNGVGEPWPPPQQDMYERLCAALIVGYGLQVGDVFAHHEWAPTRKIDPWGPSRYAGMAKWNMTLFRDAVAIAAQPTKPAPEPTPPTEETPDMIALDWNPGTPGWTAFCWTGTELAHTFNGHADNVLRAAGVKRITVTDEQLLGIIQSSHTTTAAPAALTVAMRAAWD